MELKELNNLWGGDKAHIKTPLRFRMRKITYIAADPVQFLIGEGFINLFENDLEKIVWVKVCLKVKALVLVAPHVTLTIF